MFRYGSFLWVSLCAFMINIFRLTAKCIERLKVDGKNQGNGANFRVNHSQEDDKVVSMSSRDLEPDFSEEKRSSEFSFSFLYQESKDSRENFPETDDWAFVQSDYGASTRKYQFLSCKGVSGFVQRPEIMSFTVQEMFLGSTDVFISNDQNLDLGAQMNENVKKGNSEEKVSEFDSKDPSIGIVEEINSEEESVRMQENVMVNQEADSVEISSVNDLDDFRFEDDDILYDLQLLPRSEFSVLDLSPKSESSVDDSCADKNLQIQPETTEVSSDELPDKILASSALMNTDERKPETNERSSSMNMFSNTEAIVTADTLEDTEYIEFEPNAKNAINTGEESLPHEIVPLNEHEFDGPEKFGKSSLEKESWESDSDDEAEDEDEDDELDILWEHQQLVQQMKMEMKNSKIKSLPTISEEEECETPKMVEDLKPLKIEEKFEYKDLMGEIHKFYKSYAEKIRKLDILNYQSLHAINIVQLKDSRVFGLSKKASFSSIKHFAIPSFGVGKQRKIFADPSLKSITEMQRDLELVYIGQVCLSWEILRWEYGKLKLLLEYDSQGYHSYNLVAGEYQQLQVLMQRFLEDEPFQGPRVQHYVKTRSFCRGLLQVPIIKDDCFKDRKDRLVGEKDAIPITKLAEIIKESMQVFWEFICSDKEATSGALKRGPIDHPNSADLELLTNIKTCLEKKERKLKDIKRSANCIVKKFQKHQAAGRPSSALFISQVELKLVSRVLNMSRLTTDQLLWCQRKLNNINIVNRKVHVEPSFLLFPC